MPRAADNPPAVVLGGGIAGLAAARLLTRHYARVVVLERDTRPDVAEPESAYGGWQRRGVPQFRNSHAFLARLRLVLLAHLPEVLDRLRALGVRELGLAALAPPGVTLAPEEGDDGGVKVAIFPGDNASFSISVGAPVADGSLRGLSDPARFEAFVRAFPAVAPWRARGVSVPIDGPPTPVLVMGNLRNRLRRFVDREGPLAAGFFAIGDAAYHSNPVYGRGATSAIVQAALLDEALGRHPGDVRAAACFLDLESERQLRPFWEAAVAGDRRALGEVPSRKVTDPLP